MLSELVSTWGKWTLTPRGQRLQGLRVRNRLSRRAREAPGPRLCRSSALLFIKNQRKPALRLWGEGACTPS